MTPIALNPPADIIRPGVAALNKTSYADFRAELRENGFAVLKGVVPKDRAIAYQEKAYDWVRSFSDRLDFDSPDTWVQDNLPLHNKIRVYNGYCIAHEQFMWDARMEPGVLDAFSRLWGTEELLTSFDVLNVTFPNRKDLPLRKPWQHIDQRPSKRGVHCVQGIINLSTSGPEDGGLVVYPKSHKYNDEFFDSHPEKSRGNLLADRDVYLFDDNELAWFQERGLQPHKVCAEPGDLLMWDSRVIHYGSDPTEKSTQIRAAIYTTYLPASLASSEQLESKKQVFEQYGSTTHWPFEHIVPGKQHALLEDGTRDPRDRDQPLELPVLSDKLLKLAGVKRY